MGDGEGEIYLIHGHGHNKGISVGLVNTNTGYFGLKIRSNLRHAAELRQWIKYTTLNCQDPGVTSVKLKRNPNPSRSALDSDLLKPRGPWSGAFDVRQNYRAAKGLPIDCVFGSVENDHIASSVTAGAKFGRRSWRIADRKLRHAMPPINI